MHIFINGKTGKHLYWCETWKMKGRGDDKVIDSVKDSFAWEDEIPSTVNRFERVVIADIPRSYRFAETMSKKLKVPVIVKQVALTVWYPWFDVKAQQMELA